MWTLLRPFHSGVSTHLAHRRGRHPVIENRIEQHLIDRLDPALVTGPQGDGGGQTATRRHARHDDLLAVDIEPAGTAGQPAVDGKAVVDRRRVRMLGREPVVDRDDRQAAWRAPAALTETLSCSGLPMTNAPPWMCRITGPADAAPSGCRRAPGRRGRLPPRHREIPPAHPVVGHGARPASAIACAMTPAARAAPAGRQTTWPDR